MDVFVDDDRLNRELDEAWLRHRAPNCATFSKAREIPIAGVPNAPRPVRSGAHPLGIPEEVQRMSGKQRARLHCDSRMANMAAEDCIKADEEGKPFSLEHPAGSIALDLDSWKRLLRRNGVMKVEYTTCMFEGSRRRKRQVLITNVKHFRYHIGLCCSGGTVCDRNGLKHLKWRPKTFGNKVVQFTTGEEREYPKGFCEAYAKAVKEFHAEAQGGKASFMEIFSGPNAPLSKAVADVWGIPLPGRIVDRPQKGIKRELHQISQLMVADVERGAAATAPREALVNPGPDAERPVVENLANRLAAIEAARQPGYGKNIPLIEKGLNDPETHLSRAVKLKHPFNSREVLKEDHSKALKAFGKPPLENNARRLRTLAELRVLAKSKDIANRNEVLRQKAGSNATQLGLKPNVALMEALTKRYAIEDTAIPDLCLKGMPIVGTALTSPLFNKFEVEAEISLSELLRTAPSRRETFKKRIKKMAEEGDKDMATAIFEKTLKEVKGGSMSGPFTEQELEKQFGKFWNLVPAFGLHQGEDEKGLPKFRRIDDHSASWNNAAGKRLQKIPMAMVDYIMSMISESFSVSGRKLVLSSEDMKSAYRQVPLLDSQTLVSITGVYNPTSRQVDLFVMHGQPFGAAHSVPNFYRVSEWANRCIIRAFSFMLDHFFDDFFLVSIPAEANTSAFCLRETFSLLGLTLDADKSQPPSEAAQILGVVFCTSNLESERLLKVEPKPTRRNNLKLLIRRILAEGQLNPTVAASLVGKFGFLCSTLFGKIGRACTGPIRARQYSTSLDFSLNPQITLSLKLMEYFAIECKPRSKMLNYTKHPLILYTDASDVEARGDNRWVLGAVLVDPNTDTITHTSWVIPRDVVESWASPKNYMGQIEILAGPLALFTWKTLFHKAQFIHFVDNISAASNLIKGFSPIVDSAFLVSCYWVAMSQLQAEPYIDYVESKSNLADGPSRLDCSLLATLQSRAVSPNSEALLSHLKNPFLQKLWDDLSQSIAVHNNQRE